MAVLTKKEVDALVEQARQQQAVSKDIALRLDDATKQVVNKPRKSEQQ